MKRNFYFFTRICAFGLLSVFAALLLTAGANAQDKTISSRAEEVDGLRLHYLTAGKGPTVILLHGYAETSRMWRPILPVPAKGLDMRSAAISIHALARKLGVERARVVGHDIGLMVAYAYAALFPAETEKLAVMDAFLPGVSGWEAVYNNPGLWHFRFHGPTPEALVKGRERMYFDYYWNDFAGDKNRSLPPADREAYTAAYARPGRMTAGWAYFAAFPETAKDFAQLAQTKLTMPVLAIGGEKSLGEALAQQMKLAASDVTVVVLKDTGHWVLEERPKETTDALVKFL